MLTRLSVEIPQTLLLELLTYINSRNDRCSLDRAATEALRIWLRDQTGLPPTESSMRGYQWKTLFLPEGTCLRSWSYGEHNYARVVGDQIIHQGQAVTPNQFARSFARTERNAWRDLFIKRPDDRKWHLANVLRRQLLQEEADNKLRRAAPPDNTAAIHAGSVQAVPTAAVSAERVAPPTAAISQGDNQRRAPRCTGPVPGWDLPERRKWRIRLEDFE